MVESLSLQFNWKRTLRPVARYMQRPLTIFRQYDRSNLSPDLLAGVTVAVISLPQAIAFALLAGLPPETGLYATIISGIFGALWGSSAQAITGPANAISLLVFSALATSIPPNSGEFVIAAGLMAVMVGVLQLVMGLVRLGILINFVSHSVIVGFATGAGLLIVIKQLDPLLGLDSGGGSILEVLRESVLGLPNLHWPTAVLGIGTTFLIILLRRLNRKLPGPLIGMIVASLFVFFLNLDEAGVAVIGDLPARFPPLADLPLFDLELIARLSSGALAVAAIGLVQTAAITRSVSAQTGQRLDSNQEFVGQGLANLFSGLFSGYAGAASFSRTVVNLEAGARTPFAAVFSSIFILIALFLLGPLAVYLPRAALAGVLILTAFGLIDRTEIVRIWRGTSGDAVIMVVTFLGTLFLAIEFAVLAGLMLSLVLYILRTSTPRVHSVVPGAAYTHFDHRPDKPECPQLGVIEIFGDLYFGAVNHIEEAILDIIEKHPEQRFLMIRMNHVNHCDFSGIYMLEGIMRSYRERGGDIFLARVTQPIMELIHSTGFDQHLGEENILNEDKAISHLFYHKIDPAVCIYECPHRVFKECQNLPKRTEVLNIPALRDIPEERVFVVTAQELWQRLHNGQVQTDPIPYVVDVREPREYRRGHIAEAHMIPMPSMLSDSVRLPNDRQIILVCRSGRRSRRVAYALQKMGIMNVAMLQGGMIAWEAAGLLNALGTGNEVRNNG